jgi:hypothetical protein
LLEDVRKYILTSSRRHETNDSWVKQELPERICELSELAGQGRTIGKTSRRAIQKVVMRYIY